MLKLSFFPQSNWGFISTPEGAKQKDPKPYGFESFWHAVRDSNPRPSGT